MENMMNVAKALDNMYFAKYDEHLDQLKMHKLMYFSQRESLMLTGEVLFEGDFYGWKYGPVLKEVRKEYSKKEPFSEYDGKVSDNSMKVLQEVMDRYAGLSSWKLSSLSHKEFSWRKSRVGLKSDTNGNVKLLLEAMRVDALREAASRKAELA